MFVRKVSMRLKSEAAGAIIIRKMEDEIIPLLRKQKGFLDEMTPHRAKRQGSLRLQLLGKQAPTPKITKRTNLPKLPACSLALLRVRCASIPTWLPTPLSTRWLPRSLPEPAGVSSSPDKAAAG